MGTPRIDRLDYNAIINGGYDFAQREPTGATQTTAAPQYLVHDRWYVNRQTSAGSPGAINVTNQLVDKPSLVEAGFPFTSAVRLVCNTVAAASPQFHSYGHRVEGRFFAPLLGKKCVYQFWAKANVDRDLFIYFLQASNTQARKYNSPFVIESGLVWKKYQYALDFGASGVTDPVTDNNQSLEISFRLGHAGQTEGAGVNVWEDNVPPFYVAQDSFMDVDTNQLFFAGHLLRQVTDDQYNTVLNGGLIDMGFSRTGRDYADELQLCQRYYEKSYNLDAAPGTITNNGRYTWTSVNSANSIQVNFEFMGQKRSNAPVSQTYSPTTGSSGVIRNDSAASDVAVTPSSSDRIIHIGNPAITEGQQVSAHWTADDEL